MANILISTLAIALTLGALMLLLAFALGFGSMLHRVARCLLSPETLASDSSRKLPTSDDLRTGGDSTTGRDQRT